MLVDVSYLAEDGEQRLDVAVGRKHADQSVLEVQLEELLGGLAGMVLPLDQLQPYGPPLPRHPHHKLQYRLRLIPHLRRHRQQLPLRLCLGQLPDHLHHFFVLAHYLFHTSDGLGQAYAQK